VPDAEDPTPEAAYKGYTIVVGVSGTSKSPTALAWAQAQAKQNDGRVVAVRAWRPTVPQATPSGTPASRISREVDVEQEALESLEADVARALGPDHDAEVRLVRGGRFRVLAKVSRGADLLVIDAPRQLLTGPMFAHRLIYTVACPVVVMPPPISGEPQTRLTRVAAAVGRSVVAAAGTAGRPGGGYRRPPLPHEE
jgi:nucleotide-binding universal stress UspA family protein